MPIGILILNVSYRRGKDSDMFLSELLYITTFRIIKDPFASPSLSLSRNTVRSYLAKLALPDVSKSTSTTPERSASDSQVSAVSASSVSGNSILDGKDRLAVRKDYFPDMDKLLDKRGYTLQL